MRIGEEEFFAMLISPIVAMLGGMGNEALDAVDTAAYWQVAGIEQSVETLLPLVEVEEVEVDEAGIKQLIDDLASPDFLKRQKALKQLEKIGLDAVPLLEGATDSADPEVARSAELLLGRMTGATGSEGLNRLMAIRTLGEMKVEAAVPHLEKLAESPEPFVADYAKRALANIADKPYAPAGAGPDILKQDLRIGLSEICMLAHARTEPRPGAVVFPRLLVEGAEAAAKVEESGFFGIRLGHLGFPAPETILKEFTAELYQVLNLFGNFRIDSATAMVSADVGPRQGAVVLILRGLYEHSRVKSLMQSERMEVSNLHGKVWLIAPHQRFVCHLPSKDLLIFVLGPDSEKYARSISERMAKDDVAPVAGPAAKLLDQIPEDAVSFGIVTFNEAMTEELEMLKSINSVTAWIAPIDDSTLRFNVHLDGREEPSVKEFEAYARTGLSVAQAGAISLPVSKELRALASSVAATMRVERDGTGLSASLELPRPGK